MCHRINGILLASSKYGKRRLVMKNYLEQITNSWYFKWIGKNLVISLSRGEPHSSSIPQKVKMLNLHLYLAKYCRYFVDISKTAVADPGEGPGGGAVPPLIFRTNWGPKGRKKILNRLPPLCQGLDSRPPLFEGVDPPLNSTRQPLKCSTIKSNFHILTMNGWAKNKNNKVKKEIISII